MTFTFGRKGDEYILRQTEQTNHVEADRLRHETNSKGKVKRYGKYTVQSTFSGKCSITDIMNCYIERKASLQRYAEKMQM